MAGRFSIEAVFKAVDRVTAPVSRMQSRIGKFTRGMARGLRTANRHVDKLVNGMRRGIGRVLKFGGALAAIGGAAIVHALNRTADSADKLAKQSRRLQFPIEELQEWKFVAEQSGVSNDLLDKSLGAFSKRLGEAKSNMGPLVSGLKNLNPQLLQQLKNTDDVGKAFALYIDAIREADTATEKAALANAAFSRQGLNLVNIADNSSAAIARLREEQRENGNITMEQAEAAEAYNDAVNSLKRSLTGLMSQVLLPMMPAITKTLRGWRDWIAANREMLQTRIIEFMRDLKARVLGVVDAVIEFSRKYDLGERLGDTLDTLGQFARFLSENGVLILKLVAGVVALSLILKTLAAVMGVVNAVMALNPIGLIVLAVAALVAILAAAVYHWDDIKAAMERAGAAIMEKIKPAIDWLKGAAEAVTDAWDRALGKITGIADKVKNVAGGVVDKISGIGGGVADFFGFGGDDEDVQRGGPGALQTVSPQERTARSIEEQRTTSTAEVTIRDDTGRAEVTRGRMGNGVNLQPTGGF